MRFLARCMCIILLMFAFSLPPQTYAYANIGFPYPYRMLIHPPIGDENFLGANLPSPEAEESIQAMLFSFVGPLILAALSSSGGYLVFWLSHSTDSIDSTDPIEN